MLRFVPDLRDADVTLEPLWLRRRELLKLGAAGAGALLLPVAGRAGPPTGADLLVSRKVEKAGGEKPTDWDAVTGYNNFYELGTEKTDPAANASTLRPRPWTVAIEGEVKKPQRVAIDDLLRWFPLEERLYRMRCVEAWSMVIPWVGFPLGELVRRLEPTSRAKYVAFQTLLDPQQLPGERRAVLDWPYQERLRIDEATHPLVRRSGSSCPGSTASRARSRS
jgi:sulfoxide reductase catalytic subunit YedY